MVLTLNFKLLSLFIIFPFQLIQVMSKSNKRKKSKPQNHKGGFKKFMAEMHETLEAMGFEKCLKEVSPGSPPGSRRKNSP